jgi:hypothetical protein
MSTMHTFAHHTETTTQEVRDRASTPVRSSVFNAALVCLGIAYALSWLELALAMMVVPSETGSPPLAAMVVSRLLIGGLYLCVTLRLQWARWFTVVIGFASVAVVAPMLGAEWQALHVAALVTGSALVCKLASAIFLVSGSSVRAQ